MQGRIGALSGAASVALVILATVLFANYDYLPSGEALAEHLTENDMATQIAGYIGVVAAFLMFWFAGTVRAVLRPHDDDHRLTSIAFGGTIAAAIGLAITFGLLLSAGARAGADGGITAVEAATLYDAYGTIFVSLVGMGVAAVVLPFSLLALRKGFAARWLAWVGVVVAVGSISPLGYILMGFGFLFIVGISIWAYRGATRPAM